MNPYEILQRLPALSLKAKEINQRLKSEIVTGTSGAGMVQVSMNCALEVQSVKLDPSLFKEANVNTAEVLIASAFSSAVEKARLKGREIVGQDITFETLMQRNP